MLLPAVSIDQQLWPSQVMVVDMIV
jgi:hypothetical protein